MSLNMVDTVYLTVVFMNLLNVHPLRASSIGGLVIGVPINVPGITTLARDSTHGMECLNVTFYGWLVSVQQIGSHVRNKLLHSLSTKSTY